MDLFDLFAKITLDTGEYEDGLKDAERKTSKFADTLKNGLATAAKIGAAAIGTAATGIGALVKNSVDAYANYEQLVGGVETLFDSASDKVQEYAARAYETAGMSANEYMEQATSFAASLVNSLATTTEQVEGAVTEATIESLNKNLEATKDAQEKNLDIKKRAQEDELEAVEKSNNEKIKLLQESQEKELEDYEKLVDEKIKLIDKQYNENLKLVDEEKYNRLQAVQAEIDAINAEQAADDKAAQKKAEDEKKASLQEKINNAKDDEERKSAQADLDKYLAELEAKRIEESRKARIEELKTKKDEIKQEAEDKKTELKNQRDDEVAAEKEKSAAKIKEMKAAHADELAEQKEANSAIIKEMKRSQEDELQAIKDSNAKKLSEMKNYIAEQKKLVTDGTTNVINKTSEVYDQAADIADMIMTDMSDNVNKMGSSMESIQNAYNGFSKQNYTMLDNLKLGYGGTQAEMQRLLDDAEKLSGVKYELGNFADMAQAIHVIQTEMHISGISAEEAAEAVANGTMTEEEAFKAMGTTAKEAATTISGSFGAAKAAWENLVTGIANKDADFGDLINKFVDKVTVAAGNIMPVAEKALDGVARLVEGVLPIVANALPQLIADLLPTLMDAAISFVSTLGAGISANLEPLMDAAFEVVNSLISFITDNAPAVLTAAVAIIGTLVTGIADQLPTLVPMAVQLILDLTSSLIDNVDQLVDAAVAIIEGLTEGIINSLPMLLEQTPVIIGKLVAAFMDAFPALVDAAVTAVLDLNSTCIDLFPEVLDAIGATLGEIGMAIADGADNWNNTFEELGGKIFDWQEKVKEGLKDAWNKIIDNVTEFLTPAFDMGREFMENLIDGIINGVANIKEKLKDGLSKITDGVKDFFGGLFGDGIDVNANVDGSHAGGLDYVPFDGYIAELHRGERVLTATEANSYNQSEGKTVNIYQTNTFGGQNSLADQEKANQRLAAALTK